MNYLAIYFHQLCFRCVPGYLFALSIHRFASLSNLQKLQYAAAVVFFLTLCALWSSLGLTNRLCQIHPCTYTGTTQQAGAPARPSFLRSGARPAPITRASSHNSTKSQRPLLILHWTEHPKLSWFTINNATFSSCLDGNCMGTADRSLLMKADAVLIHGLRLNMKDLPKKRLPHQRYVFVIRESPQSMSRLPLKDLDGLFNLTMTYSRHSDVLLTYGHTSEGKQRGSVPTFHPKRR